MTVLIVTLAWVGLSLFGWSLLRAAAQADRNSRVQPMRPWARDLLVSSQDVCDPIASSAASTDVS